MRATCARFNAGQLNTSVIFRPPKRQRKATTSRYLKLMNKDTLQDGLLTELGQALVHGSLTDKNLLRQTAQGPVVEILPDANVVKIGGQSAGLRW